MSLIKTLTKIHLQESTNKTSIPKYNPIKSLFNTTPFSIILQKNKSKIISGLSKSMLNPSQKKSINSTSSKTKA
jgi:hypothetical protein